MGDEERGTGRTTRQLQEMLRSVSSSTGAVYVVHSYKFRVHVELMLHELTGGLALPDGGEYKIEVMEAQDARQVRDRLRGRRVRVYFDHAWDELTWEHRLTMFRKGEADLLKQIERG